MPHAAAGAHKLYYERHGADGADGVPLLLVVGLGGSCQGWVPLQVPELSRNRALLLYDHRGVAQSDDPGGAFTTADLADDADALLETLGIPQVDVLGAFLGGMVGQELALRHPQRVRRLVLVGTYARPDAKRRLLLTHWQDMARRGAPPEAVARERMLWTLQDETLEQTDLVAAMTRFSGRDGLPMSADVFVRQCDAALGHDALDRLRQLAQPTLLVCGRQDQLTPPRLHREMADELSDGRLVTLQYGGHLVLVECAPQLHALVDGFLADPE